MTSNNDRRWKRWKMSTHIIVIGWTPNLFLVIRNLAVTLSDLSTCQPWRTMHDAATGLEVQHETQFNLGVCSFKGRDYCNFISQLSGLILPVVVLPCRYWDDSSSKKNTCDVTETRNMFCRSLYFFALIPIWLLWKIGTWWTPIRSFMTLWLS